MSDQIFCSDCKHSEVNEGQEPCCICSRLNPEKGGVMCWEPKPTTDNVNSPPHYTAGGIECIDAIKASMSKEEYLGYLKGNCIKYLWRYRHKGGAESLAKADWYLQRLRGEMGE